MVRVLSSRQLSFLKVAQSLEDHLTKKQEEFRASKNQKSVKEIATSNKTLSFIKDRMDI